MKKFKKLLGLVLALAMALAFAVTASAASIIITAPANISLEGVEFSAYKIFGLQITDSDEFIYTIDPQFAAFGFNDGTTTHSGDNLRAYLSGLDGTDLEGGFIAADIAMELTKQLKTYISANGIIADETATGTSGATAVTISGLGTGYYIVIPDDQITAMPILSMLTVTNESKPVTLKADAPTVVKKVNEVSSGDGDWQDHADYNIGDTVPFRLQSAVPAMTGYDRYYFIVHDDMSAGLTFDGEQSVSVEIGNTPFTGFNVVTTGLTDDCEFHIEFDPDLFVALTPGADIYIYYTATLNEGAVIAGLGNPNTIQLEYSNNPYNTGDGDMDKGDTGETPKDTVIVYTFEFEVVKVNGDSERLNGAKFALYRESDGNKDYAIIDSANKVSGWSSNKDSAVFTVDEAFAITGLDAGTYYLEETEAPSGYNMLDNPFEIVVAAAYTTDDPPKLDTLTITYDEDDGNPDEAIPAFDSDANDIDEVLVLNQAGIIFPETGGIGTTIFYIVGTALMVGAAVLLIAKKKISSKN